MTKKAIATTVVTLSVLSMLSMASLAEAKHGGKGRGGADDIPNPECQVEDGGIVVCR